VTRSFTRLSEAAAEAGQSRIYGGGPKLIEVPPFRIGPLHFVLLPRYL
jgi:hypothetical protein